MTRYIALNGWIYCGFGGEKKPLSLIKVLVYGKRLF